MKKLLLNSIVILSWISAFTQKPLYQSKLDGPVEGGFYKIALLPAVIAGSATDLSDLRLWNANGEQVPYIIKTEVPVTAENRFIEFPLTLIKKSNDSLTHIVFKNVGQVNVKELLLTVGNTSANRTISVNGSTDSLQWFSIREDILLEKSYEQEGKFVQSIDLPSTDYNYYEIVMNGKNLLPVNILKAGVNKESIARGTYQELPRPKISEHTSGKSTYVTLEFERTYQLDELKLEIEGQRFYKRSLKVYYTVNQKEVLLNSFMITSGQSAVLPMNVRTNLLRLEILNEDNPPLVIKAAQAFQLNRYLLVYLEKGDHYTLTFGDAVAVSPQYDLSFFSDSIRSDITSLVLSDPEKMVQHGNESNTNSELFLWLTIAVVLVILLLITLKMIKEVNRKQKMD